MDNPRVHWCNILVFIHSLVLWGRAFKVLLLTVCTNRHVLGWGRSCMDKKLRKGAPIYRWFKTHTSSTSWGQWWETYSNKNSTVLFKGRSHSKKGYWQVGSRSPQFLSASSFMISPKSSDKYYPRQYCQSISYLMKVTWWHCRQTETWYNWWATCLCTMSSINCLRRGVSL